MEDVDVLDEFQQMDLQNNVLLTTFAVQDYESGRRLSEREFNQLGETRNLLDLIGMGALAGYSPRGKEHTSLDAEAARYCGYAFETWKNLGNAPQKDAEFLQRMEGYQRAVDFLLASLGQERASRKIPFEEGRGMVGQLKAFLEGYGELLSRKLRALEHLSRRLGVD